MRKALLALALSAWICVFEAQGAAKKPPAAPEALSAGKRVIAIEPIQNVRIELPDQRFHDFGSDFQAALSTRLEQSGKFIVVDPEPVDLAGRAQLKRAGVASEFHWPSSSVPAATVRFVVEALSLQTGSRGGRMFYGFNPEFRTEFNNGVNSLPNEFPLSSVQFQSNWFDRTFDSKGSAPFDSLSGLDLGEGFQIQALAAWLDVKYATYQSRLQLRVEVDAPLIGRSDARAIQVNGKGYFFDLSGAYLQYSAGIQVARSDAMLQAMRKAVDGAYEAIERSFSDLPLTARIDATLPDQGDQILLGTGFNAQIVPGTQYEVIGSRSSAGQPSLIEVVESLEDGAVAKWVSGPRDWVQPGALVLQKGFEAAPAAEELVARKAPESRLSVASIQAASASANSFQARELVASETVDLPWTNLKKADLKGVIRETPLWKAILKSLVQSWTLPYRIWRFFQYDRGYQVSADGAFSEQGSGESSVEKGLMDWVRASRSEPWAQQIGASSLPLGQPANSDGPLVAVLDSGVDYNHPILHDSIFEDRGSRGWDFISGDERPYDDHYHGTEVASLILAVAPQARILPVKVFNPYGITDSAALLAGFQYALKQGAKVIVCAWATRVYSKAIELGVQQAQEQGVLVIAAAGDRGDSLRDVPAYPAAWSSRYDNVLTAVSVDPQDRLVQVSGRWSNFDPQGVTIAAPGLQIRVANPRNRKDWSTSTSMSAALVAGAALRILQEPSARHLQAPQLRQQLMDEADRVASLGAQVAGGLRLRLRK